MSVDAANALLAFYAVDKRRFPWRAADGAAPDPYRVWLSEIMLQQTTTTAAIPYFRAFTARWPTIEALAAADEGEVMAAWAGLGYYARARNLVACARTVAQQHGGSFPRTRDALRGLPGIGAYTSAAIAAIAFGERVAAVEANAARVVARLHAVETPLPAALARIETLAEAIVPEGKAGDFAQALMDLGATICTPRRPDCGRCPLSAHCAAFARGDPETFPRKAARRERPHRHGIAWWIERDGEVLLVRRPPTGLLGGMLALPSAGWDRSADPSLPGPAMWEEAGAVEHGFTHFIATVALRCVVARDRSDNELWWPIDRLADAGLPSLFARLVERGIAWREQTLAA